MRMPDVAGNTRVCVHKRCHNAWTFPLLDKLSSLLLNVVAKSQAGNRSNLSAVPLFFLLYPLAAQLAHSVETIKSFEDSV